MISSPLVTRLRQAARLATRPGAPPARDFRHVPVTLRLAFAALGWVLLLLLTPALLAPNVLAQETRPTLQIERIDREAVLDEWLEMKPPAGFEQIDPVTSFVQRSPDDGEPITERTEAYLWYDERSIQVVFLAFDSEPELIRANLTRREAGSGDDIVEIQLDTFNDELRAFSFICNPYGVQSDAIYSEQGGGGDFDFSWNAVWDSNGRLTDRGYVVVMRIPFTSLRFDPAATDQKWGVLLVRDISRRNENTFWPQVSNRLQGRLNQSGRLRGLRNIAPGRNIQIIPYATAFNTEITDTSNNQTTRESFDPDFGLDAKWVIQDRLALDLTVNPDFSQVESDAAQVTVNERFAVRFPERRPFFLENATLFTTPLELLFTRRIADPSAGARLTGKIGNNTLGALLIDDEAPGKSVDPGDPLEDERAKFGVLRFSRELGNQSSLGVLYTERRFENERNRVTSLDGRFKFDDNWFSQLQAVHSATTTLDNEETDDQAFNAELNRQGRAYGAHIHYREVGPDFRTDAGFIRRTDVRNLHTRHSYRFWQEPGKALVSWQAALFGEYIEDHEGLKLDRRASGDLSWSFRNDTNINLNVSENSTQLRPRNFSGLSKPETFPTDSIRLSAGGSPYRTLRFNVGIRVGEGVNFTPPTLKDPVTGDDLVDPISGDTLFAAPFSTDETRGDLSFTLRPTRRLNFDTTYLYTQLDDSVTGERVLLNQIIRSRINYQFTRLLTLRTILQWDRTDSNSLFTTVSEQKRINADFLLTYLVNPWTAFYLGTNSNFRNLAEDPNDPNGPLLRTDASYFNDAQQFFFKVSYLFTP